MDNHEFRALGGYKKKLFDLICNSEKSESLIDLVMPELDDARFDKQDNFLGGELKYNKELVDLQGRLFDVPFIYAVIDGAINCICIDTNISKLNQSLKEMVITINVMCHKDKLRLDTVTKNKYKKLGYYGNRLDIVVALLQDIVGHSMEFGIGELRPITNNPVQPYFPNKDFFGKTLIYNCTDFMTDFSDKAVAR